MHTWSFWTSSVDAEIYIQFSENRLKITNPALATNGKLALEMSTFQVVTNSSELHFVTVVSVRDKGCKLLGLLNYYIYFVASVIAYIDVGATQFFSKS